MIMENTARQISVEPVAEQRNPEKTKCEVVEFTFATPEPDSLSENFINELDAWARQALASNGFGDY
jgi:hypothetical protein